MKAFHKTQFSNYQRHFNDFITMGVQQYYKKQDIEDERVFEYWSVHSVAFVSSVPVRAVGPQQQVGWTASITDKAAIIKICWVLKKAYLGLCYANHIFPTHSCVNVIVPCTHENKIKHYLTCCS